jgi:AraC-like DNA-binding protein
MAYRKHWSPASLDKARGFQLATELAKLCACYYPFLLPEMNKVLERLQPLRLSPCGRQLRAWGRDYHFEEYDVDLIRHLVNQYHFGTRVVPLPLNTLVDHAIRHDGIVCTDGHGMFWIEEPAEEKAKPPLVIFPASMPDRPRSRISKEAMALAALADHPDWSDEQIAELAGCSRSSLYRMPRYTMARQALYRGREKYRCLPGAM